MKLLISSDIPCASSYELKEGRNLLGRAEGNDILLFDPAISARHCELVLTGETLLVRDLLSTNGTYINGKLILEAVLHPGQTLRAGSVTMQLDAPPVIIAIPPLLKPEAPVQTYQEDGSPNCLHHPDTIAKFACTRCDIYICDSCVKQIRRVGGIALMLCPGCSGRCQTVDAHGTGPKTRVSLIRRLKSKAKTLFLGKPPKRRRPQ